MLALSLLAPGVAPGLASGAPAGETAGMSPSTSGAEPASSVLGDPFVVQTREVQDSAARIAASVPEVEGLRAEAQRIAEPARLACLEEKLGRIRRSLEASDVIRRSWPTARPHPDFALRSLERMRLLKLYAMSAAEEAHRCADIRTTASTIVRVDRAIPDVGRPGEPVRPPVFERPPLASPY